MWVFSTPQMTVEERHSTYAGAVRVLFKFYATNKVSANETSDKSFKKSIVYNFETSFLRPPVKSLLAAKTLILKSVRRRCLWMDYAPAFKAQKQFFEFASNMCISWRPPCIQTQFWRGQSKWQALEWFQCRETVTKIKSSNDANDGHRSRERIIVF